MSAQDSDQIAGPGHCTADIDGSILAAPTTEQRRGWPCWFKRNLAGMETDMVGADNNVQEWEGLASKHSSERRRTYT